MYSLSAKTICAFNVNELLKFPIGSSVIFPLSKINLSGTMSIKDWFSGISISLTCIKANCTSFDDIPAYLSFTSFVILFWTTVTYFPGIVI